MILLSRGVFFHRHRYVLGPPNHPLSNHPLACLWWESQSAIRPIHARPISLLRLSLLRLLDSNFPGNPLWAWEFHPLKLRWIMFWVKPSEIHHVSTEIGRSKSLEIGRLDPSPVFWGTRFPWTKGALQISRPGTPCFARHYLSDATCLTQPQLFSTALCV